MTLEPLRNVLRRRVLMAHSHDERLQPSVEEKGRVRIERAAQMIQAVGNPLDPMSRPDHGTGDDVGMAVEVLRSAVQYQIEALLDRLEVHWRRERIVDERDEAMVTGELNNRFQVCDLQQRVGQALDVDGARIRPDECWP
jgi:hypothetical protein